MSLENLPHNELVTKCQQLQEQLEVSQSQNKSLKAKNEEMKADLKLTISTFRKVFLVLGLDINNLTEESTSGFMGKLPRIVSQLMIQPKKFAQKFQDLYKLSPLVEKYKELF